MEPTDPNPEDQDPFQGVPKIESETVNQGIIPESLIFWRRWHRKPASAS